MNRINWMVWDELLAAKGHNIWKVIRAWYSGHRMWFFCLQYTSSYFYRIRMNRGSLNTFFHVDIYYESCKAWFLFLINGLKSCSHILDMSLEICLSYILFENCDFQITLMNAECINGLCWSILDVLPPLRLTKYYLKPNQKQLE